MIFSIFVINERDIETTIINPGNPSRKKQSSMNNQITKSELALRFIRDIE